MGSGSAKGGGELGGAGSETCDGEVGRVELAGMVTLTGAATMAGSALEMRTDVSVVAVRSEEHTSELQSQR